MTVKLVVDMNLLPDWVSFLQAKSSQTDKLHKWNPVIFVLLCGRPAHAHPVS